MLYSHGCLHSHEYIWAARIEFSGLLKDKTTTKNTPQVMKLGREVNLGEVRGRSGGEILTRLVKILISFFFF